MFNSICLVVSLNTAAILTEAGEYEASQKILKIIHPKPEVHTKYCFYNAVNSFSLNQREEAKKWLNYTTNNFNISDKRYIHIAELMSSEIENWKDSDVSDIGRDMKISADRLASSKGDKKTQDVQKQIIDKLDKLIKEKEDAKNGKNGEGDGKESEGKGGGNDPSTPKSDSYADGGKSGKGIIDEKKLKGYGEKWGQLPEQERAKIIQEITRDLPPKYKPMIEDYLKSINKTLK